MKNLSWCFIYCIFFSNIFVAIGQDSLSQEDIAAYSYPFTIEKEVFVGKGATILTKAIGNASVTMLGDNNRSKLEAEFTNALIQELNRNDYKTMVLEIGESTMEVIKNITKNPSQIFQQVKALNQQYGLKRGTSILSPIPEFKSVEATHFLESVAQNDWSVMAVGTENWTSYKMLIDELYANLSKANQAIHQTAYQETITFLDSLYTTIPKQSNATLLSFTNVLNTSSLWNDFLAKMATFQQNEKGVKHIKTSLNHWSMYGNQEFYKKNRINAKRNKTQLTHQLKSKNFEFSKDKLFIKMWVSHLAKGTTVSGFYGVGNMLQEMADYHDKKSLNIAIARRFYEQDGEVKDIIDTPSFKYANFQELIPLGKKEEWVLIDLRPFNKAFYWEGKLMSVPMHKIISRYDMLVIPKIDAVGTINH